jgi:hypothetical protein
MARRRRLTRTVLALSAVALAAVGARRSLLRVRGPSMRPTLHQGDLVVTVPLPPVSEEGPLLGPSRALRHRLVRRGALVVLSEPGTRGHLIIKRVSAVGVDGVEVVGDDPGWSIDSRTFGTVPHRDVRRLVLGRVPGPASLRSPTSLRALRDTIARHGRPQSDG